MKRRCRQWRVKKMREKNEKETVGVKGCVLITRSRQGWLEECEKERGESEGMHEEKEKLTGNNKKGSVRRKSRQWTEGEA